MRFHAKKHHRRHRKRVFGKRATRAIQAIAGRQEETKWSITTNDVASIVAAGTLGANSFVLAYNIFDSVPRADSTGVSSRSEVLGQEAILKGISVRWLTFYPANDVIRIAQMRISIVESTVYQAYGGAWVSVGPSSFFFEDEDGNTNATMQRFDMDRVKVLASKKFAVQAGTGRQGLMNEGKLWVRKNKKIVAKAREGGTFGDEMNELKDKQYYVVAEWYDPRGLLTSENTPNPYQALFDVKVYWKDP